MKRKKSKGLNTSNFLYFLIVFLTFLPLCIALIGSALNKIGIKNDLEVFHWILLVTMPIGFVAFVIVAIIEAVMIIRSGKKRNFQRLGIRIGFAALFFLSIAASLEILLFTPVIWIIVELYWLIQSK